MKVCNILLNYYPIFSGRGSYWRNVMGELQPYGVDSMVISFNEGSSPQREVLEGINIVRIPKVTGKMRELRTSLLLVTALYQERSRYEIVHIHAFFDAFGLLFLFSRLFNKKIIFNMTLLHSDDPLTWKRVFRFSFIRLWWISKFHAFIAQSPPQVDSYIKAGLPKEKIFEVPNGVNTSIYCLPENSEEKAKLRRALGLPETGIVACFVGAIIPRKGLDQMLSIWSSLAEIKMVVPCVLVGPVFDGDSEDGRYCKMIIDKANDLNFPFKFLGRQDNVANIMKAADFFVLPSLSEGFPNVAVEALASGLPVLISPLDGISERIIDSGEEGFICKNTQSFVEAIVTIARSRDHLQKMSVKSRRRATEEFSLKRVVLKYLNIYNDLVAGK